MNPAKDKYLDAHWILAMVHTMIEESIYHTETFSHALKVHHNDKAAKVFHRICEQFKAEQRIVLKDTLLVDLPDIAPWEVPYEGYQHPSSVLTDAHYLMSESEAWKVMHGMIENHHSFYKLICKANNEDTLFTMVDQLISYCKQCEEENKRLEAKADTKRMKDLEDLDVIALHSSEGGLW